VSSGGGPGFGPRAEGQPPLVSVIITNHNYARYLPDAVESALAQTHPRTEVVVVDDGSTDGSRELLERWRHRAAVLLQENAGQAAALNAGFAASRGDLILFLDADDALEPHAAASLAAAWRPGAARVHAPVQLMDGQGRLTGGRLPSDPLPSGDLRPLVLAVGGYPSTGTTGSAFSRACLERLMPVPEREWSNEPDVYLWILAPFLGEIVALDGPTGRVRVHDANKWTMTALNADRLLEHMALAARKDALLRARGDELGTTPPADWLLRDPLHLQARLALLRLAPDRHPFPADRVRGLARHGVVAALRHPGFRRRKRILMAAWFVLAAGLPRGLGLRVILAGLVRTGRPAWLQRFIGGGRDGGRGDGRRVPRSAGP
jgi:glycosyltransferase involved in cell wall biosynthesis